MSETIINNVRYMDIESAAKAVRYSKWYLRKLCRDGRIPFALRYKGQWVFPSDQVQYLKAHVKASDTKNVLPINAKSEPDTSQLQGI